jgi:Rha family phage regulatory protein
MISNIDIDTICEEVRAVGLEPIIRQGGKHAAVTWRVGEVERVYHTSLTPSDHRSHLNARSEVRRMLRSDGLLVSEEPANVGDRPRLFLQGGAFHCSSRDVAAHFGKQHKNVLRDIDRMLVDLGAEFGRLNFEPTSQPDAQGRQQRCFNLSRDGFVLLAMGFSGADAMAWKVKYLEAFNLMEAELRRSIPSLPEDAQARLEKVEGDLAALVDLCLSAPQPEPGYIVVKAYKRRARGRA